MATVGSVAVTMHDLLKRLDPNLEIATIIEVLKQDNPILDDMMYTEANGLTSHRTTIRTGLPEAAWRLLNYGVPRSKSKTTQVEDRIGMLETWAVIDKSLADLNNNSAEFMLSEDRAFLEGMGQQVARTLFYGDLTIDPASFLGLTPRYNDLNPDAAETAEYVYNYGGTNPASNTSIWLISWGDRATSVTYPRGSNIGLTRNRISLGGPNGAGPIPDENGNEYLAYKTHYKWDIGLVVRDWRYNYRICNIDVSELDTMISNGAALSSENKLYRVMIDAVNSVPNLASVRPFWYCNKTVGTMLDIIAAEKPNVYLNIGEFEGRKVTMFRGIPIRITDAIENAEALVTASA